jgi:hypothetical protein
MTSDFKIFYDSKLATEAQLDEIEEIIVEQEIDQVWQARIKKPVCISEKGVWEGEDTAIQKEFERVRIEVRKNKGDFVPLIDGLVVGQDAERTSSPGNSMLTIIVHDDSAKLHREDRIQRYDDGGSDSEIAKRIFKDAGFAENLDVEPTPERPPNRAQAIIQNTTKMKILRSLAALYKDFYAYVLPTKVQGVSIGCFKKLPIDLDKTLPKLEMFGENANLAEFNVRHNAQTPSEVTGAALSLRDKSITTSTSSYRKASLLGDEPATEASAENITKRRLPPGRSDRVDLKSATQGAADTSAFALEAEGSVLPLCYAGVLSPYRMIKVCLSKSRFSTNYIIFKVVHTITRSHHTQNFTLKGDSFAAKEEDNKPPAPAPSASLAVTFNAQINIF